MHYLTFEHWSTIILFAQFLLGVTIMDIIVAHVIDLSRSRKECSRVRLTLTDTFMKSCVACVRVSSDNSSDKRNIAVLVLDSPHNAVVE